MQPRPVGAAGVAVGTGVGVLLGDRKRQRQAEKIYRAAYRDLHAHSLKTLLIMEGAPVLVSDRVDHHYWARSRIAGLVPLLAEEP